MKTVQAQIAFVELRESKFPKKDGSLGYYTNLTFKDVATGDKYFFAVSNYMPPLGREAKSLYKRDGGESALGQVLRATNSISSVATKFNGRALSSNADIMEFKTLISSPILITVDANNKIVSFAPAASTLAGQVTQSFSAPVPSFVHPVEPQPAPVQKTFPRKLA